jgi:Holliday junction resolvasome RuvABC endonuclease subunit
MAKKKKPMKYREYELPQFLYPPPEKLMLGCDPGSRSFGISLVGVRKSKPVVYANGVLNFPVNDLINFNGMADKFLNEIDDWMAFKPDAIIGERFQTRGNGGPLIEQVSVMLGLMHQYGVPMKLTVASAWKNAFNRRFQTDLRQIYPTVSVQPHQLDASLIAIYGLEKGLDLLLNYTPDSIIAQVERKSLI